MATGRKGAGDCAFSTITDAFGEATGPTALPGLVLKKLTTTAAVEGQARCMILASHISLPVPAVLRSSQ